MAAPVTEGRPTGVEPIVHHAYDGGILQLPRGTVLDPAAMPVLAGKAGHDIVTAEDGVEALEILSG